MKTAASSQPKILEVAAELFMAHGFSGTSMGEVAKQAHVPKSLIYHHFKDKAELWKAVKMDIAQKAVGSESCDIPLSQGLRAFLSGIIEQRIKLYQSNPAVLRLMLWQQIEADSENLEGGLFSPESWLPMIKTLQDRGDIRLDLNPHYVAAYLFGAISPLIHPKADRYFFPQEDRDSYLEWLLPLLEQALAP